MSAAKSSQPSLPGLRRLPGLQRTVLVVALLGAARARVAAQQKLGTVEVEGARQEPAPEIESPSFVTVVDARSPSARVSSVADLIEREAGVQVRSLGGLGAFTSVSIRGSDATEVAVYLDGVPLNRAASGAVDLSQIPVENLERVEIYRGLPPAEFGGQAIGGAINLVTRKGGHGSSWRGSLGGGSFGTRSASVGHGTGDRAFHADAGLAYRGSQGNFPYYDYNGTPLRTDDDRTSIRQNNDFNQLAADVSVGGGKKLRWDLGAHAFLKNQGVPGRGSSGAETHSVRYSVGRVLLDGAVDKSGWPGRAFDVRLAGHLLLSRTAFDNHLGEIAGTYGASFVDGETWVGGVDASAKAALGSLQLASAQLSLEAEGYRPFDLLRPARAPAPSSRVRGSLMIADDLRLFSDRLAITPAVRVEAIANQLSPGAAVVGDQAAGSSTKDAFPAAQLGLRLRVAAWLSLKGSVGRYVRVPTTTELFGDGAFLLPRPSLRPETSVAGDLGAVVDVQRSNFGLLLEAAFFGRQVDDFIAIVPSSNASSAENVGNEKFLGAEVRARLRVVRHFFLSGDYTLIHSINDTAGAYDGDGGKLLPGVPEHRLNLRAELRVDPLSVFYELAYTSDVWLNAENTEGNFIPARALHAVGLRVGPFPSVPLPFTLSFEVRNLADLRVVQQPLGGLIHQGQTTPYPLVDFYDYPLPGRAFFVTLAAQK